MVVALYNLVGTLLLAASLVTPSAQPLLKGESFARLQQVYTDTVDRRGHLIERLRGDEAKYRALLARIDGLRKGADTLQNRMELEDVLRDGRRLADQMQALQQKIHRTNVHLDNQRTQLVAAIDARMKRLEAELTNTSADERAGLVASLNELRARRTQFTAPLPDAPTNGEVDQTLTMVDDLDDAAPEDLLAVVDELRDTEDQVRKRLGAVKGRIDKLKDEEKLARRARQFAVEEQFFDESTRSRFVADSAQHSGGDQPAASDSPGEADSQPSVNGRNDASATVPVDDSQNGAGQSHQSGANEQPYGPDGFVDNDATVSESVPGGSSSDSAGSQADGIFGASDEWMLHGQSSPRQDAGSGFDGEDTLTSEIHRLESECQKLEEQADRLDRKATRLRKRARKLVQ